MIVQCKEEDVEKNGYTHADTQTHMQHNDPAQYTVLGWVKNLFHIFFPSTHWFPKNKYVQL